MRIAIIGAGLTGLSAAHHLAAAGLCPVVFDKSRGLGGRLATRRSDAGAFNHGAPRVCAHDAAFAGFLERAVAQGAAVPLDDGHVGKPGMSGIVRPLAEGSDVRLGVAVTGVALRDGQLRVTTAEDEQPFDRVISAVPVVQAVALVGGLLPAGTLDGVRMDPCWSVMIAAAGSPRADLPPGVFDAVVPQPGVPGRWVAHATPEWSRKNLERDKPDVARALAALLGFGDAPHVAGHRWRHARTAQALGHPFAAGAEDRVLVGGDWALGDTADHAWQSGAAMARAVLG